MSGFIKAKGPVSKTAKFHGFEKDELELQYNAQATVDDFMVFINDGTERSRLAYETLECLKNQHYGPRAREVVDIFPAKGKENPILIVVHGGYWRAMSKEQNAFVAPPFVQNGVSCAIVEYDLAPDVSLAKIVEQVRNAVCWIYRNANKFNGDKNKIYVVGSSAGAHLLAMVLSSSWEKPSDIPENIIKGGVLLSGLYDLEPLLYCSSNEWLRLNQESAEQLSPVRNLPRPDARSLMICAAEDDTEAFKKQSYLYSELLNEIGIETDCFITENENHFNIFVNMADADNQITRKLLQLINE